MRDYQRKNSLLPHNVYMQVRYKIKDYDRLKQERDAVMGVSARVLDGMPRGTDIGDPTAVRAEKLLSLDAQICAVDAAAKLCEKELRGKVRGGFSAVKAYWSYDYFNYMHRRRDEADEGPSARTWNYFKERFSKKVAEALRLY